MKVSYNWLKQFINLSSISPKKLANDLSLFGLEAESVKKVGKDYILNLEITPNRGDCLSIIGIARELSALYDRKLNIPKINIKSQRINKKLKIDIKEPKICPRFTARIIDNISIGQSPQWLIKRLNSYGFRALNNIIDITNYVMIETGQPLHAFDYDKISNGIVKIRQAKKGESIITLDGKNNDLDNNTIIIKDDKTIYDLAGIMGGYNSEVDNKTKTILLQGSILDPILIRRTSKKLAKTTDASYRFERGVDYSGTKYALERASELIKRTSQKAKIGPIVDVKKQIPKDQNIKIDIKKINNLLGIILNKKQIINYLDKLGFKTSQPSNYLTNQLIVKVPYYRKYDVTIWQDIAEEVARVYGYNSLRKSHYKKEKVIVNKKFVNKESLKDILVDWGFTEVHSYSFSDEKLMKLLGYNLFSCRKVINPVAPENRYLRPSLEPSILTAISKNPWAPEINIFEIGKIFSKNKEYWQLAAASTQKKAKNLKNISLKLNANAKLKSPSKKVTDFLKIRKNFKYFVINFNDIKYSRKSYKIDVSKIKYKKISNFAPSIRDLAFIVDKNINAQKIRASILNLDLRILLVELFDEFVFDKSSESVKKDLWSKKNVAYHVWLQDLKGPISQEKSDIIVKKIIKYINTKYKAKLR